MTLCEMCVKRMLDKLEYLEKKNDDLKLLLIDAGVDLQAIKKRKGEKQ